MQNLSYIRNSITVIGKSHEAFGYVGRSWLCITLDDQMDWNDCYHPKNGKVCGVVNLNLRGIAIDRFEPDRDIRFMGLSLTGESRCEWSETHKGKQSKTYTSTQQLINEEKILISGPLDQEATNLFPTIYKYPFAFEFPPNLPASMRGKHGRVRYLFQVEMQTGEERKTYSGEFIMKMGRSDISPISHPRYQLPDSQVYKIRSRNRLLSSCFMDTKPAKVEATLNLSGQKVQISVQISGKDLSRTVILPEANIIINTQMRAYNENNIEAEKEEQQVYQKVAMRQVENKRCNQLFAGEFEIWSASIFSGVSSRDITQSLDLEVTSKYAPMRLSFPLTNS